MATAQSTTAQSNATGFHRYGIGIMVRISKGIPLYNAVVGPYEVTAQLPEREGELQYRIKSDREPYQRIAKEGDLECVGKQSDPNRTREEPSSA